MKNASNGVHNAATKRGGDEGTSGGRGDEWVLAIAHGNHLIGRRAAPMMLLREGQAPERANPHEPIVLSPVYTIQVGQIQTPQGIVIKHSAIPLCMLHSVTSMTIPADSCVVPLSALDPHDRRRLMEAANEGEQLRQRLRTADSGIVVTPQMPNPPPMGGRG